MKKMSTIAAGIVAVTTLLATPITLYRDYLADPDLLERIVFDFKGEKVKEKSVITVTHQNNLYKLLEENDTAFKEELEKESKFFSRAYHLEFKGKNQFYDPISDQLSQFGDNKHFIAYLKSEKQFLKKSLEIGHFLDAALMANKIGYEKSKVDRLLSKKEIQTYKTGGPTEILSLDDMKESELESLMRKLWFLDIINEIHRIEEIAGKTTLERYGETRRIIKNLAQKKYRELLNFHPDKLDLEERIKYRAFLFNQS